MRKLALLVLAAVVAALVLLSGCSLVHDSTSSGGPRIAVEPASLFRSSSVCEKERSDVSILGGPSESDQEWGGGVGGGTRRAPSP